MRWERCSPWSERSALAQGQRREHNWVTDPVFESNKSWTNKDAFNKVLDEYYKARGWGVDSGIPTRSELEKFGLKDVADDLEKKVWGEGAGVVPVPFKARARAQRQRMFVIRLRPASDSECRARSCARRSR